MELTNISIHSSSEIDYMYITNKEELQVICELLKSQKVLCVDTETYVDNSKKESTALDPHSSLISLIQINYLNNKVAILIDTILINKQDLIDILVLPILMNKEVEIVMHNTKFDLQQLYNFFGVWINNVWCTKVLNQSLSLCTGHKASLFRGNSLKDLARDYFDLDYDKTEATSQWGRRPLSYEQLIYAALDVGAPKNSNHYSVVLEIYQIVKHELLRLDQDFVLQCDQEAMFISAKMEYHGMYVDVNILFECLKEAMSKTNYYREALIKELGFNCYYDLDLNEDGEWEQMLIVPDKIKTLLNNNKDLVDYVNNVLASTDKKGLTSLQAEEVKLYLDKLESDIEENVDLYEDDFIEAKSNNIQLIKNLLNYKKFNKLISECKKYIKVINPNTGHLHAGFNSIGSSSGRMSSSGNLNLQQTSHIPLILEIVI